MNDLIMNAGNELGLGRSFSIGPGAEVLRVPGLVLVSTLGECATKMEDVCSSPLNCGNANYPPTMNNELLQEIPPALRLYRSVIPGSNQARLNPGTALPLSELATFGSGVKEFELFAAAFEGEMYIGQGLIRSKTPHKTTAIFTPEGGRMALETVGQTELWAKRLA